MANEFTVKFDNPIMWLDELPPLFVRVAPGSPPFPFLLFDVWDESGFSELELTRRQVDHVARTRGLRVVPVTA